MGPHQPCAGDHYVPHRGQGLDGGVLVPNNTPHLNHAAAVAYVGANGVVQCMSPSMSMGTRARATALKATSIAATTTTQSRGMAKHGAEHHARWNSRKRGMCMVGVMRAQATKASPPQ